jgi:hypothetical protein
LPGHDHESVIAEISPTLPPLNPAGIKKYAPDQSETEGRNLLFAQPGAFAFPARKPSRMSLFASKWTKNRSKQEKTAKNLWKPNKTH